MTGAGPVTVSSPRPAPGRDRSRTHGVHAEGYVAHPVAWAWAGFGACEAMTAPRAASVAAISASIAAATCCSSVGVVPGATGAGDVAGVAAGAGGVVAAGTGGVVAAGTVGVGTVTGAGVGTEATGAAVVLVVPVVAALVPVTGGNVTDGP